MLSLSEQREIQDWRDGMNGGLNDPKVEVDRPDVHACKRVRELIV